MGDFAQRIGYLRQVVGAGNLEARVTVNQVYAKYQHEGLDLKHPRGGRAKYLGGPVLEHQRRWMQLVADKILVDGGRSGMIEVGKLLVNEVYLNAPVEFNDLKNSGACTVTHEGRVIYRQLPNVPRLTEAQLRAKDALRNAINPHHWYGRRPRA